MDKEYINNLLEAVQNTKIPGRHHISEQDRDIERTILNGAMQKADQEYREKIKPCKGGIFKGHPNPQKCFLKAKRSSFRAAISYVRDRIERCKHAENPRKCQSAFQQTIKDWGRQVEVISMQIEDMD